MLTERGWRDRMWSPFPALRQLLEGRPLPRRYQAFASTDDTVFERLARLAHITALLIEQSTELASAAKAGIVRAEQFLQDVASLQAQLAAARNSLDADLHATESVRHQLEAIWMEQRRADAKSGPDDAAEK